MGVYEKLGVRKIGLRTVELINWVRLYGLKDGLSIVASFLQRKNSVYKINASFLRNPVYLRDNYSDRAIFLQVFYEKQYEVFDAPLPSSERIIDAGANIGLASVFFANKFPQAQIIAIEPELENFALLQKNTKGYNVDCLQAAIWNKNELLYIANPETLPAGYIMEHVDNSMANEGIQGITVNDIMKRKHWQTVDIVKMDIEGAEKEVFEGDIEWLNKTKLLIIELHDRYKEGTTKALFKALDKFDYKAYFHHENIFVYLNRTQ